MVTGIVSLGRKWCEIVICHINREFCLIFHENRDVEGLIEPFIRKISLPSSRTFL